MRDYDELVKALRMCKMLIPCNGCPYYSDGDAPSKECGTMNDAAADAIEELLAFAKFVAREAIDTGDNDGVSAEILCRKLNKLGLIETDGEFWMLPAPPKGVE